MIAAIDEKIATRVGEFSAFNVFDPGAVNANGHIMLGLTRDGAGMAANTLALVNDKCIFGHNNFPLGSEWRHFGDALFL